MMVETSVFGGEITKKAWEYSIDGYIPLITELDDGKLYRKPL